MEEGHYSVSLLSLWAASATSKRRGLNAISVLKYEEAFLWKTTTCKFRWDQGLDMALNHTESYVEIVISVSVSLKPSY